MNYKRPSLAIERLMIWVCSMGVCFALGLWVGGEQSAVKLQPCQKSMSDWDKRKARWPGIREGEKLAVYFKREGLIK